MAYEVLARKWRPKHFGDLVGQAHVARTLTNAIESDRVAHAYVFVGPRGIGKTSTARILARALNCEKGPTPTPCDTCSACTEIAAGNALDVLEIDGASNNGVEQVRSLRDNAAFAPARGPYKIYIIDEVHMLSIGAFNALLKILEEPPPHVKFIFATTEPQKVPATILSRCQRFDLRRIPAPAIVDRLRTMADAEHIEVDAEALPAIARMAEGGLRDAISALDQLVSFQGKSISEQDVLDVFGLVSRKAIEDLAQAILNDDVASALEVLAALDEQGKDLPRLLMELLDHFRNVLIVARAGEAAASLDLMDGQLGALKQQATDIAPDRILRVVEILTETEQQVRYALSPRTYIETAIIRCGHAASVVSMNELLERIAELRADLEGASPQKKKLC